MTLMHHTGTLLLHFLTISQPIGYVLVFLGGLVEGDLSLLTAASLTRLGYFEPVPVFLLIFLGSVIGDTFWFWVGRRSRLSSHRMVLWAVKKTEIVTVDIHKNFFGKLLLSKFMYGTHRPFLLSIGYSPLTFRMFVINEMPAVLIWMSVIGSLGYTFTSFMVPLRHTLKYVEIVILIVVVLYLGIRYILKKEVHVEE